MPHRPDVRPLTSKRSVPRTSRTTDTLRSLRTTVAAVGLALALSACSGAAAPDAGSPDSAPGARPAAGTSSTSPETSPAPAGAEESAMPHPSPSDAAPSDAAVPESRTETATFGAGCFWCTEAVLEQVDGVLDVRSGYMGGTVADPTYRDVCGGDTGHAEVVQVHFDPAKVSYDTLLDWFWQLHDPTTLNRQGADVGTQYRSVIFYHSEAQREAAERSKAAAQASGEFDGPIVTEISPAASFYPAEDYHQDYYRLNASQGYCRAVIAPKLKKLGLKH